MPPPSLVTAVRIASSTASRPTPAASEPTAASASRATSAAASAASSAASASRSPLPVSGHQCKWPGLGVVAGFVITFSARLTCLPPVE